MSKTLLLKTAEGDKRVDVDDDVTFTFGPAIPGPVGRAARYEGGGRSEYAVRLYKGKKSDQSIIAVFTGVHEVRWANIAVAKSVVKESGKTLWQSDEEGYFTTSKTKREKKFVAELNP